MKHKKTQINGPTLQMDKSSISERITEIIAAQTLCSVAELTGTTRLYHDLKIGGDDAIELLDEISDEFKVQFDDSYIDARFPTEMEMSSISFALEGLFGKRKELIATTIDDLVNYVLNFRSE